MTRKVAVGDLTLDQEEQLSAEFGVPFTRWAVPDGPVPLLRMLRRVYETVTGEAAGSMTITALMAAVSLEDEPERPATPEGARGADPTPSAPVPTT